MSIMPFVSLKNVTKTYPGVIALDNVSLDVLPGEVHALVGENGAGKSTLIKTVSGAIAPDTGSIVVEGTSYEEGLTPALSLSLGISVIYQEVSLIDTMSVAENISLSFRDRKLFVDFAKVKDRAIAVMRQFEMRLAPDTIVSSLSIAQQQMIEIAKAMASNAKLIIMDEPTATLTVEESEILFKMIGKLKEQGVAIVYISHRMEEIFHLSDRVTVMRDGKWICTEAISDVTVDDLIRNMVGRNVSREFVPRTNEIGEVALEVKGLYGCGDRNINFSVRSGEVLGIQGLVGAGRTELARMIFGAEKIDRGEIYVKGEKVNITCPTDAINHGIGLIPEDRKNHGVFLGFSIDNNITISILKRISKKLFVNQKKEKRIAEEYSDRLRIKAPSTKQLVKNLSGGNQQKVVLSKVLVAESDIIIFDEPTRGIDVGAKSEIYDLINELAAEGKAIILISSELHEILGLSDKIIVMHEGKLIMELNKGEFDPERIIALASGIARNGGDTSV